MSEFLRKILPKTKWKKVSLLVVVLSLTGFLLLELLFPLPNYSRGYSTIVYSSDKKIIHAFLSPDDKWRIRADYNEISPDLLNTIIYKEDKYFYYHPGVNPISVIKAAVTNLISGEVTSGASTISMQVARLISPDARNLRSKIREAFRAFQLELHYSKKEILTMYLNLLPYGGNIEGIKAASLIYFGQEPSELSPAQIVMLTVIPNNPNVLMPHNRSVLMNKRNTWLIRFGNADIFNKQEINDALSEGFESKKYSLPRSAPHIAYRLVSELSNKSANSHEGCDAILNSGNLDRIYSTIDLTTQSKVESTVANYIRGLRTLQITNCAVIVVNNRNMEVKAYAGSAGFNETEYSGQVDGVQALRSPGSTLKPALYMLAFDRGITSPKSVVTDVPIDIGGYRPENYDESYRGTVTIEKALSLSLNVPAVELLDKVGLNEFNSLLSNANFKWIARNKKHTGLSLILGGCGTTLEELAGLYAAFANDGHFQKLQYTKADFADEPVSIGSSGSSYMITEILTQLKRPDLPLEYVDAANLPKIAWKTGTSYGRRDAWAIGYNADHTIAVWVGNFDGKGVPELNGSDCAVPLLFMLFNQLNSRNTDWFFPTYDTDFRLVCSESGMVPDTFCHDRVMETYLPGISPSVRCNHLKPVFTNNDESVCYCSECLPARGYKTKLYPNYPPELIGYYQEMQIPFSEIPDHNPQCSALIDEPGPHVTSLTDGAEYLVFEGRKQKLMLKSNCENGVNTVFWYIDKKYLGKCSPNETLYLPAEKGKHTITCADDKGRTSSITITVSLI